MRNLRKPGELPPDLKQIDPRFSPTFKSSKTTMRARGIWHSRGYGYVIDLRGDTPDVYIGTGSLFWHTELGRSAVFSDSRLATFYLKRNNRAVFAGAPGGTRYEYDRISKLPATCTPELSQTPAIIFDAFWTAMNERYAFFGLRRIDWSARRRKYRPKALSAKNDEQLFSTLTESMTGFGDGHLTLSGTINGEVKTFRQLKATEHSLLTTMNMRASSSSSIRTDVWNEWVKSNEHQVEQDLMPSNAHHALNGHMTWGSMDNRIGYLCINLMTDYGGGTLARDLKLVAEELDKALDAMSDCDAMIVDITQNRGGDDRIARAIASRFADKKRLAYTKHVPVTMPQPLFVYRAGPRQFVKPVYLMTSELTHSAAEIFALTMRVLPNVLQAGENTGGAFSDQLLTPLPNGWLLTLSNEIYLDSAGRLYERNGIPAHKRIEIFKQDDLAAGHVSAVRKVLELARKFV